MKPKHDTRASEWVGMASRTIHFDARCDLLLDLKAKELLWIFFAGIHSFRCLKKSKNENAEDDDTTNQTPDSYFTGCLHDA